MPALVATAAASGYRPFLILALCVALVVLFITKLRLHPFLALLAVAMLAGILAPAGSLPGELPENHWLRAVELVATELGVVCGKVAIVIGLASVIGVCVMESGAADRVVRQAVALFGPQRAGLALLTGGFLLGLPIFFDTLFLLLIPLARALYLRTGRDYTLYVLAICCAGAVTHSTVAPHPGPLAMIELLSLDLGQAVVVGIFASILPVALGWQVAHWLNRRCPIPMRNSAGVSLEELKRIAAKRDAELPSLFGAVLPVLLPMVLMSAGSMLGALREAEPLRAALPALLGSVSPALLPFLPLSAGSALAALGSNETLGTAWPAIEFVCSRNVALIIGAALALRLVVRQAGSHFSGLSAVVAPALESAGVIILITSAGGAFGAMLRHAGVGDAIQAVCAGREVNLILLAWTIAVGLKFAQGSATVSMLTTAGMMAGVLAGADLPFHPLYIFLAIGFGALGVSWMNDSGFWVIGRLSGFTERETLRTWTPLAFSMSCFGLVQTLLLSKLLPFDG